MTKCKRVTLQIIIIITIHKLIALSEKYFKFVFMHSLTQHTVVSRAEVVIIHGLIVYCDSVQCSLSTNTMNFFSCLQEVDVIQCVIV